jgi:hypothetical protein
VTTHLWTVGATYNWRYYFKKNHYKNYWGENPRSPFNYYPLDNIFFKLLIGTMSFKLPKNFNVSNDKNTLSKKKLFKKKPIFFFFFKKKNNGWKFKIYIYIYISSKES